MGTIKKLRRSPPSPKMVKHRPVAKTRQYWFVLFESREGNDSWLVFLVFEESILINFLPNAKLDCDLKYSKHRY